MGAEHDPGLTVIRGRVPGEHEPEYAEFLFYDSGRAEREAAQCAGPFDEPWLNVLAAKEPASLPAADRLLCAEGLRRRIRRTVLDVGAGTCWLSAKLSRVPEVDRVYALDLSERFLLSVGQRMVRRLGGDVEKVTFVASSFNEIPLQTASVDCAFLFGCLHHSLSPVKTLIEVGRCVMPGGAIIIFENPVGLARVGSARRRALALTVETQTTEIAYTRGELEYLIANARIGTCETVCFDVLSRPGIRRLVRRAARFLGVEHLLLNPPQYLFIVTRAA